MNNKTGCTRRFLICWSVFSQIALPAHAQIDIPQPAGTAHDLVIRGGRVMDPESGLDAVRNIGVSNGIIRSVSAGPLEGGTIIDATGLVVAPGFIDMDGYLENARHQVRDGVTTVFDIRMGTAAVDRWYAQREDKGLINFGVGIGYLAVRSDVMGQAGGLQRERTPPSEAELTEILGKLRLGFDRGAVALGMGVSGGLDPTGWEIIEAFTIAAGAGAHVVATLRDDTWTEVNINEHLLQMIGAAAVSGAAMHIPHLTSSGGPHTPRMLWAIARARDRGLDITAEDYPYRAAVISLAPHELDAWPDEELSDVQPMAADERLSRQSYARYRDQAMLAFVHNDSIEPFVIQSMASPFVAIASHGSSSAWTDLGRGHPRTSGTYSRVLGRYVREQGVLSLMEGLRKMTLMPAERLGARVPAMRRKGRIREGADADIVVFDADRIIDRATFQEQRASEGVRYVLVNGVPVVIEGVVQEGVFPGRSVRAPFAEKAKEAR